MRAFDVLTKAEDEIRGSTHPRYHLEMALLRWIHLRKLVPLSDLIQGFEKGAPSAPRSGRMPAAPRPAAASAPAASVRRSPVRYRPANAATVKAVEARREVVSRPTRGARRPPRAAPGRLSPWRRAA